MRFKAFTLIELMTVVLIVSILAAVVMPIYRDRVDAAKWSEAKTVMGIIATGIRTYHMEHGEGGTEPNLDNPDCLGLLMSDLNGKYFIKDHYSLESIEMDPLTYTIKCDVDDADSGQSMPSKPKVVRLDQSGNWSSE
ncbi:Pilin [Limihaloglobus sulfuriphilus]|uniref:Pilin n=1 Tax=Limihaloglobus sulfuriphilus TaxID=1851148 RepID=A0A1Q2ME31_9BACT|nr:prepilin-type N-terminal cleavage/methylation domain-containing protein [Limihaloglobus sulfuriphilus]AQQ70909.1 Pilin [Limihaloglobus sulfuriphilus]